MSAKTEKVNNDKEEDRKPAALELPKTDDSTATNTLDSPSNSTPTAAASTSVKCSKCAKKAARKGCTQTACFACCEDEHCSTHAEVREQNQYREQVLAGTTPIQVLAREKRAKAIPPGSSKEPGFSYLGDTVVVWDLHQYMANPAWREDALRKTKKRKARQLNNELSGEAKIRSVGKRKSRRQKFAETMEKLYQKSLTSGASA